MNSATKIIQKFGGQSKLASLLGRKQTMIQYWSKTGLIPVKWHKPLLEMAEVIGISLSPEDFIETSLEQVEAPIAKATHQGELPIGDLIISCAVLNDSTRTRVFSERSIANAFGIKGGGAYWKKKRDGQQTGYPEYISASYLIPFVSKELRDKLAQAIPYLSKSGVESSGISVTILSEICDVYITAFQAGNSGIRETAQKAYSVLKALANVGVIALVDEVTGYQHDKQRSKDTLQQFFKKFLLEEASKWVKTFEDEFFEMIFRMKGWDWLDLNQKPGVIGRYINDIVYDRIAPGVLEELRVRNPTTSSKTRKFKHHQFLSKESGHPKLKAHLEAVMALGRASKYNWKKFYKMLDDAYPRYGHTLSIPFDDYEQLE